MVLTFFCPMCRHVMDYDSFTRTYRCDKTDFHPERCIAITTGLTRFKGNILKPDDDIEKSHILLILKQNGKGTHGIIKDSEITVHSKAGDFTLDKI